MVSSPRAASPAKPKLESLQKGNYFVKDGLAYDGNKYKLRSPRERDRFASTQQNLGKSALPQTQRKSSFRRIHDGELTEAEGAEPLESTGPRSLDFKGLETLDFSEVDDLETVDTGEEVRTTGEAEDEDVAGQNVVLNIVRAASQQSTEETSACQDTAASPRLPTTTLPPKSPTSKPPPVPLSPVGKLIRVLSGNRTSEPLKNAENHDAEQKRALSNAADGSFECGEEIEDAFNARQSIAINRVNRKDSDVEGTRRVNRKDSGLDSARRSHGLLSPRGSGGSLLSPRGSGGLLSPRGSGNLAQDAAEQSKVRASGAMKSPSKKTATAHGPKVSSAKQSVVKRASSFLNLTAS
eukprot:CAMPEP_0185846374 /NCGR_PEP_ID=MMETSP1354-20130828/2040_1 /TAXON_ID=708628 /ORGANISM="Erythrolobus madagascarensis, Strain CCMP3276" /LENGTH=351 /DNA_ID=CAMNT_0028546503 /DNA_START=251 /DNA_END=1306 /DNA_ORIENTATION=-